MDSKNEIYTDLEEVIRKTPIEFKSLNYDSQIVYELGNAYIAGRINENMLRLALDRNEITLLEYVKIITK